MKCQLVNSFHKLGHSRITLHQRVFMWFFITFVSLYASRIPLSLQLDRSGKRSVVEHIHKDSQLSSLSIKRLYVFPQQLQHCLICRGSNASPAEMLVPEVLTGYCEVQNLNRKDTSSWNWKNIMPYDIHGCSLNSSSSQNSSYLDD